MSMKENDVFKRILDLAKFAKSVLHLPFPELELVNPSFSVIAKHCDLASAVLKEEAHAGTEHASYLAGCMRDIATAIVDRDDASLIDSMAILDEFLANTAQHTLAVVGDSK